MSKCKCKCKRESYLDPMPPLWMSVLMLVFLKVMVLLAVYQIIKAVLKHVM